LDVELHLPHVRSLKDKRALVRPIVDGSRVRFKVAAAEVSEQDRWQLARLAFVAVSSSAGHTTEVLDAVERFVWSFPEVEVVSCERFWCSP
jgi:uncharacterized protein YlxP (DUF503 family)